jgi:hypothetical protein
MIGPPGAIAVGSPSASKSGRNGTGTPVVNAPVAVGDSW